MVLPKGTVESDEEYKDTAIREVKEETGASATIIQYVGKSHYSFTVHMIQWKGMYTGIL